MRISDPSRGLGEAESTNPVSSTHTFFFTRVTGPRRSLSLKLSDARVYEPQIRARLGTTALTLRPNRLVGSLYSYCSPLDFLQPVGFSSYTGILGDISLWAGVP